MSNIEIFKEVNPTLESYWRSIILFGRNVASYKFALAKSLLEIAPTGQTEITLEELAKPFLTNLCEHIKNAPKQATSSTSQFLEACKGFNEHAVSYEQLIDVTVKKGFNNVIDAFHVVNDGTIPVKFYSKDYSKRNKKIILTDNIFKLQDVTYFGNFMYETESRWNLVETAWEMGISRNLLNVNYDDKNKLLFIDDKLRRKDVTSARDALNGYQKGKCFYCYDDISVSAGDDMLCDVDHFFPHILQSQISEVDLNGVWNLVLACPNCNRGAAGKFALVPEVKYLERLHKRNEYLISSHHPLRETLMNQTGQTVEERIAFLKRMDNIAINNLIHRWGTEQIGDEAF
jgi:hypothetical protein